MSDIGPVMIFEMAADLVEQHAHISTNERIGIFAACLAAVIADYPIEKRTTVRRLVDVTIADYLKLMAQP